jgi:glycosyltransferase involved in cell wall biosynthesis
LPTGALAPLWARWTKQSYIVALRGSDVPGYDGGALLATLHRTLRRLTRRILVDARRVTANSESLRELAERSFPGIPIEVITNGVCTTTFRPNERRPEAKQRRLLCVARLVPRKGLEDLVAALSDPALAAYTLTIVGDGPLRSKLKTLARSLGVAHRVVFAGRLHGHELSECYGRADCFVLPSHAESCSMSLLEAMASGLPVVAARTGGIPEFIEDERNGKLFTAGDVRDLAAAVAWMFESDARRQGLGSANRERAIASFGWPAIVSSYEQRCYGSGPSGPRSTVGGAHSALQAPCDHVTP